jgi:hypothetical protein
MRTAFLSNKALMTTSTVSATVAVRSTHDVAPDSHQPSRAAAQDGHDTKHAAGRRHRARPKHTPPPSRKLPAGSQLAARGAAPSGPPGPATQTIAANPPQAPSDARHATDAELTSLLARYDDHNANAARDTVNAEMSARLEDAATAGYPDDARRFEQDVQRDLGMLAQLPSDVASSYRDEMKATWDAFEATPDAWLRDKFAQDAKTLRAQIVDEYQEARTDPVQRAQAIFNAPFGSDLLGDDARQDLDKLRDLAKQFRRAQTKEDRESIFATASEIKKSLQDRIFDAVISLIDAQRQAAASSEKDVMQALESAQGLSGSGATSGGRLEHFANRVFVDAAHARAFTELRSLTPERMQQLKETDPERFARLTALKPERLQQLTQWENDLAARDRDAARELPEVPLDPPKNLSDIRFNLPAPGPEYGENLRQRYLDARHSIVTAEKRISIAHERPSSPVRQSYIKTHRSM